MSATRCRPVDPDGRCARRIHAQNPTFTDATTSRLDASPATSAADTSEKDYGIGDGDGDDDIVIARRVGLDGNNGSPLPNTLLMNVDGV